MDGSWSALSETGIWMWLDCALVCLFGTFSTGNLLRIPIKNVVSLDRNFGVSVPITSILTLYLWSFHLRKHLKEPIGLLNHLSKFCNKNVDSSHSTSGNSSSKVFLLMAFASAPVSVCRVSFLSKESGVYHWSIIGCTWKNIHLLWLVLLQKTFLIEEICIQDGFFDCCCNIHSTFRIRILWIRIWFLWEVTWLLTSYLVITSNTTSITLDIPCFADIFMSLGVGFLVSVAHLAWICRI